VPDGAGTPTKLRGLNTRALRSFTRTPTSITALAFAKEQNGAADVPALESEPV
jgi:hypothetical protein